MYFGTEQCLQGFTEINKDTPRGKAVAERSAAKGKPDHSIYELLMDLQSMALDNATWEFGNWDDNDYLVATNNKKERPPGWKLGEPRRFVDLDKDFQTTMNFCLAKIAANLTEANLSSMGFAIMAPDGMTQFLYP